MKRWRWLAAVVVMTCAACGSASPTAPSGGGSTAIASLSITGNGQIDLIGLTSSLVAVATLANGTSSVVTSSATWQSSNPAAVTISTTGVATGVDVGSTSISANYQGASASLAMRVGAFIDCGTYDPSTLQIQTNASGDFVVAQPAGPGFFLLQEYATQSDAAAGLAVYQRYRNDCYVGRNNSRSPRLAYVFGYWLNQFGLQTTINNEDCEPYDKSTVAVVSHGSSGWDVMASGRSLLLLDTAADATTMAAMIKTYSNQCYIGRGNTRANASDYISRYWK
jgi:hypothetical protein